MRELVAFLGVSALVIVTPGQDTALTIRNTLSGGRLGGVLTALGVSLGQATWTLATGLGLGALLVASGPAFAVLRLLGGAYLALLGAQALRRAWRRSEPNVPVRQARGHTAFRQGLLSNLGNAKMLAFFTSLLPQFASSVSGLLALGFVFCSMTAIWLTAYAVAVARAGRLLRREGVRRTIEALTGSVLVALGVRLASD
jgi:threonine/homoserine/homoserine lactone efflux protein